MYIALDLQNTTDPCPSQQLSLNSMGHTQKGNMEVRGECVEKKNSSGGRRERLRLEIHSRNVRLCQEINISK